MEDGTENLPQVKSQGRLMVQILLAVLQSWITQWPGTGSTGAEKFNLCSACMQ